MESIARLTFVAAIAALFLTGCGGSQHAVRPSGNGTGATSTPAVPLPHQVELAQEIGPGFLVYCPLKPGRRPAKFDLDLPGLPRVGGWCETAWQRRASDDLVIFRAHWDAHRLLGRSGTQIWRFKVNRPSSPRSPHVALLISSSGSPPP